VAQRLAAGILCWLSTLFIGHAPVFAIIARLDVGQMTPAAKNSENH